MSETIKGAVQLIEQGHVRIGPEVVKDPSMLVTRTMEDFVTWVDNSKIRKHVLQYNGLVMLFFRIYVICESTDFVLFQRDDYAL